jgi:aminoglycoside/choline kinase family phosphotransferase
MAATSRRGRLLFPADGFIAAIIIAARSAIRVSEAPVSETCREDHRLQLLRHWLEQGLRWHDVQLAPASADASFRRYFRVAGRDHETVVAMDAPPEKEDVEPYLKVAGMLADIGVHAPRVLARNAEDGFLLISDLGAVTYLADLAADPGQAGRLYADAIRALVRIQAGGAKHAASLPPYDERLLRFEMSLFTDWLLGRHLSLELSPAESAALATAFDTLVANALEQPQVFVHRDYHSRNLMVCPSGNPGILDFQDAVHGAFTYDLVSLLRDCYLAWPQEQVVRWALDFRHQAREAGLFAGDDDAQFLRWFDLMGIQRHLKASGIFARLWHRDGKPGYLPDVPRTLGYIVQACSSHAEFRALGALVSGRVLPAMQASLGAGRA